MKFWQEFNSNNFSDFRGVMIFFFSIFFKSYKEHWKMAQTQGALFIDRKGMNFFVWTFLFRKPISCFRSNISVVLIFLRRSLRFTLSAGQTHLERNTSYSFYFLKELILWHHDTCSQISFQTVLFIITLWFTSVHNCSEAKLFLSSSSCSSVGPSHFASLYCVCIMLFKCCAWSLVMWGFMFSYLSPELFDSWGRWVFFMLCVSAPLERA